jgi:sporulation protein YlmC with PRC-barrel domain
MKAQHQNAGLTELGESHQMPVDPMDDLRDHRVVDDRGEEIGRVADVLIDLAEGRVRLLLVRTATTPGEGETLSLIPVDAISGIGQRDVHLNRSRAHVVGAPVYRRETVDQAYLESVYAHYGLYPYWAPGHVYPTYPAYPVPTPAED